MAKRQKHKNTAPKVVEGVQQPNSINEAAIRRFKQKRRLPSVEELVEKILAGHRVTLSRALTLIESTRNDHRELAEQVIEKCLPAAGNSIRIGITGSPGVGKSTFIEAFGLMLTRLGHKVAVLAVDPSSQVTRGSILGDKTRMANLAVDENAFIRPSPAGDSLGGVARKTREGILLCEAAGFDVVIVETVGVGQSETAVHSMVDFFLLLLLPGAGDELQGIKRGIVEMADLIAINKADGDNVLRAKQSKRAYRNALHLFPPKGNGWNPLVASCSAIEGTGMEDIWQSTQNYRKQLKESGFWENRRREQAIYWLHQSIRNTLGERFYGHPSVQQKLPDMEKAVKQGELSSFKAAKELLDLFF